MFCLFLTLYSCGNVIIIIVHFINNWFMMILVAVYVYLKINAIKSLSLQTEIIITTQRYPLKVETKTIMPS